jgi:peptidoglycan hydrolase CwlO-like protein
MSKKPKGEKIGLWTTIKEKALGTAITVIVTLLITSSTTYIITKWKFASKIDTRLVSIENKISSIDTSINTINANLGSTDASVQRLNTDMAVIKAIVERLEKRRGN